MSAEESGLEQIDEDEWTDRNFGNSTANDMNTSEDSVSDLESDAEEGEVEMNHFVNKHFYELSLGWS